MERTTRAQQRAAAIDVSPATLAAEIERLTRERDLARRQTELARDEVARLKAGAPAAGGTAGATSAPRHHGDGKASAKANAEELARQRDEYLAALQRERAEFMNFKRRTSEEREAMLGLAAEGLIRKVLALADDFDLAVEHRPEAGVDEAWVEGIAAIDRKLRLLLESEGVSLIEASPGMRFDPREHEAVANVPGTGRPGGELVDVLRRGYRLRDRVIRPALVAVAEDGVAGDETDESTETNPLIN
ncbi:MAG TPA: nucleotide exchange factor GrpE [Patescibacteria group bacterium]|jgi:molecular chaperone GrpE|nr:nucleotide exchange factor GrpE [Patescibacteria group bacterium]